jgi:hypothetical protein
MQRAMQANMIAQKTQSDAVISLFPIRIVAPSLWKLA